MVNKQIFKDRYTIAFVWLIFCLSLAIVLFKHRKGFWTSGAGFISVVPILILVTKSGRIHQTGQVAIEYKGERDCGFSRVVQKRIDGVRVNNKRYKMVNGADVYVDEQFNIKPCGPGSSLMQYIGGGGWEPESIQKDDCWQ